MSTSNASATWEGGLKNGRGHFEGKSGHIQGDYTFATRFENARGTNPEELIAAAHAACFSMALSHALTEGGHAPETIEIDAVCRFEQLPGGGFGITSMDLEVQASVPGLEQEQFEAALRDAEAGCPVSNAVRGNVAIDVRAELAA